MSDDYKAVLKKHIFEQDNFLRAIFKGQRRGGYVPWLKVTLRPVLVKHKRYIQFSYFEAQKNITKNYAAAELIKELDQLLAQPFKSYHLETNEGTIQVQITKKGKAIIHRSKAKSQQSVPNLAHNHRKDRLLSTEKSDHFLQVVGIMTPNGKIKANKQSKYRQINEFLRLVDDTINPKTITKSPLHILDFGCGSAYLSFAIYHYLNHILEIPTHLIGIDLKADLMHKHLETSQTLGWTNIRFETIKIADFKPDLPTDMVMALHACDTATDDAIAQGIKMQSKFILTVPCCHHHIQQQLTQQPAPSEFQAIFRHGILRQQFGDILTDALRASILRIMGYKTDVVEFVDSEHTPKNLMIRAIKLAPAGDPKFVQEYLNLKNFWPITPYLEHLLGDDLTIYLSGAKSQPSTPPINIDTPSSS